VPFREPPHYRTQSERDINKSSELLIPMLWNLTKDINAELLTEQLLPNSNLKSQNWRELALSSPANFAKLPLKFWLNYLILGG